MSKRLQVVLRDEELEQIREVAREQGLTVSEWVRKVLQRASTEARTRDPARKLAAVRAAARHAAPTADIDQMLAEIGPGYAGQ